jgi:drug/metabolite transporter (DMT)-like permease
LPAIAFGLIALALWSSLTGPPTVWVAVQWVAAVGAVVAVALQSRAMRANGGHAAIHEASKPNTTVSSWLLAGVAVALLAVALFATLTTPMTVYVGVQWAGAILAAVAAVFSFRSNRAS